MDINNRPQEKMLTIDHFKDPHTPAIHTNIGMQGGVRRARVQLTDPRVFGGIPRERTRRPVDDLLLPCVVGRPDTALAWQASVCEKLMHDGDRDAPVEHQAHNKRQQTDRNIGAASENTKLW